MYDVLPRIDGGSPASPDTLEVIDKYWEAPVGRLHITTPEQLELALDAAQATASAGPLHPQKRAEVLRRAADALRDASAELCQLMAVEAGFPLSDGRREVERAGDTLRLCADESIHLTGRTVPLASAPGVARRVGWTMLRPVGVVAAITPFNSPLNTVCHKIGPALAAGNAVVLKPAEQTPSLAVLLAELLEGAGLPPRWLQVVHGGGEVGAALVADQRVDFVAFTGSTRTGAAIQAAAGLRRTQLELGSISCTAICEDAKLGSKVIEACANAAFRKAGQVCTSLQRLYVHASLARAVIEAFVEHATALRVGDPSDERTQVGPMIATEAAERVDCWLDEAESKGAMVLLRGRRRGALLPPAVVEATTTGMALHDEEAFGPVVGVHVFESDDELASEVNSTPYGLAVGVYTDNLARAMRLASRLKVGTVYLNATCSSRVDLMPYGGMKASGHGQEGPRYAAREMSEEVLVSMEWDEPEVVEAHGRQAFAGLGVRRAD